ncbi:MAG: 2-C-methyl-D-erythritol 4-phosphate cytidylyltransferase [Candidatus Cloacimonadaceae bacterium]
MDILSPNTAIITAAGSGRRMSSTTKKQYLHLDGIPILIRSLEPFFASNSISHIIVAAPEDSLEYTRELIADFYDDDAKPYLVVPGGVERQDSVFAALQNCPPDTDLVFIHDGVRPFISQQLLEELEALALQKGAVIPAARIKNTVKQVEADFVVNTLQRERLIQVFTPQVFGYELLVNSYEKAYQDGFVSTDDSALVEYYGHKVYYHLSSDINIKITDEWDFTLAHLLIEHHLYN